MFARSSGWTASSQPEPLSWSNVWPVNALQPGCSASNSPDAGVFQTIATVASIRERNRSSPWRRASSARFHAVISREMPKVPTMRPSWSRNGILVVETQVTRPPPQVSFSSLPITGCSDSMTARSSSHAWRACSSVKKSKSVLPTASAGIGQAEPVGQGLVDADEAALGILEVDRVRDGVHERCGAGTVPARPPPPPAGVS